MAKKKSTSKKAARAKPTSWSTRGIINENAPNYDYRSAVTAQVFGTDVYDKESKHWGSRIPDNPTMKALGMDGRTLKSVNHPTFDLTAEGEREAGYNFASGKDRRLKSVPGKKAAKKEKKKGK